MLICACCGSSCALRDQSGVRSRQTLGNIGGNTTWDRLAEYLEKEVSGQEIFVIARGFEAPLIPRSLHRD